MCCLISASLARSETIQDSLLIPSMLHNPSCKSLGDCWAVVWVRHHSCHTIDDALEGCCELCCTHSRRQAATAVRPYVECCDEVHIATKLGPGESYHKPFDWA